MELLPFSHSVKIRSRGYLPHWEVDDAIYFITYRLSDSLPASVRADLRREHDLLVRQIGDKTAVQRATVRKRYLRRLDAHLDDGHGECLLRDPRVAEMVVASWKYFDHDRYRLLAWCVMPNHVHLVMQLFDGATLDRVIHSWKSYTSTTGNRILDRVGQKFWSRDYYDHCVRSERELANTIEYVLNNPAKIGLMNWPFVGTAGG
jgi:REP element-mobilizing transposase RayT